MAESGKNAFVETEHEIMRFWEENDCFGKLREQNSGSKRFRFLDGPITANNPMGIHHAWGRSLKDTFIRYKAMRGFDCRYQNGFDAQGLWVEVEVEKELGFACKRDIEDYGMDRFTQKCLDRVAKYSATITEQSKRLGQWMDWDHSYFTNSDSNIEGIWHFLKTCSDNGWLRREYRPMPWCPRCGTSLSEHEMTGSYKMMTHDSVFFKLPLTDAHLHDFDPAQRYRILVWTTTPWTLSSNVALAVHPELDYAEVSVASDSARLILAKNAIRLLGEDKLEVIRVFKGAELTGIGYETCFPDFEAQRGIDHRIVAWEDVDAAEGVGVVHIAPGCGVEDFELGLRLDLPQVMPVDDEGVFLDGFGFLTGKNSRDIAAEVFETLKNSGKLYKVQPHEHSYPVCWRCKTEVIFRLVPAWYIATADLKERLIRASDSVQWEPESNGKRMNDWLANMGDWNISRKRYYGMPLPFYPCPKCGRLTVVGSKKELRELGGEAVDSLRELHRPWIDEIKIICPGCGGQVSRISEIGDVWLDAGIVPFSTLGYFENKEEWRKNYPAEWVTEMREQVRLWFYSMLFMSVVLEDRAPYERVLSHSSVVAEDGSRFSKTGFMIRFDEAAEKIGADTIRYLYAGAPVGADVRFGFNLGDEARRKLLSFWNIYTFFDTYASIDQPVFSSRSLEGLNLTPVDRWLVIRTNEYIAKATECYEDYKSYLQIREFETFVDDISNWYIRTNRRRFWKAEDKADKDVAYRVLFFALDACVRTMAPIIPFMTEKIWQELTRKVLPDAALSVHLGGWPQPVPGFEDDGIIEQTALARDVIATAMRLRNEQQLKVRQPLRAMAVCCSRDTAEKIRVFEKNILDELNVKRVDYLEDTSSLEDTRLSVNFKAAGAVLKGEVNRFKAALEQAGSEQMAEMAAQYQSGGPVRVHGFDETFDIGLFISNAVTKTGIVLSESAMGMTVALDVSLDEKLRGEGAVRDIVRQCQLLRKEAGYSVEQRIEASVISGDERITRALEKNRAHIASELLAARLEINVPIEGDIAKEIEAAGVKVLISVKKV